MEDSFKNPFSGVNAVQLDEDSILDYWCNPFEYNSDINEADIYNDTSNIIFMGGRSTGKSMFLRYWSYPVQFRKSIKDRITLKQSIVNNNGLGFYFRIDGAKLKSFNGYGLSDEHWNAIFTNYLELIIGRQYIEMLSDLQNNETTRDIGFDDLAKGLEKLTDFHECSSIESILLEFDDRIREIERYLGNVPFYKNEFKPQKGGFLSKSLSYGIPELLMKNPFFKDLNFIILLDEYENFLDYQQQIINTMLRFSKHNIKLRIGMRLEGFRTFMMISDDDFIKEGREYRKVIFEEVVNSDFAKYKKFLSNIAQKRLEALPEFAEKGVIDITAILGKQEDIEEEALELAESNPRRIIDFFANSSKTKYTEEELDRIRYPQNPLMEMMNCLWVFKREKSIFETQEAMMDYLDNKDTEGGRKYRNDYVNKYKLSLMFLLCSIYRKNKLYYSFNTFAFISSGIVGHFIELCRRSFAIANWGEYDNLMQNGKITKEYQHKAAIELSNAEKQQISRIETYGGDISRFIENIGNIFRQLHLDFSIKYPETNQFVPNIDSIADDNTNKAIKAAIKWSVIQRKPKLQTPEPGGSLKEIYTINRIFAPSFQISYRTRGGKSLNINEMQLKQLMKSDGINIADYISIDNHRVDKKEGGPNLFSKL